MLVYTIHSFFCNRCAGKNLHDTFFDSVQSKESSWVSSVFARECIQHSKLHHPNIVQCYGVHTPQGSKLPMLVMEHMHLSLSHCLERYSDIPSNVKYCILRGVSLGLQYLHSHKPPIVHRDLTANNVLLTQDMRAKIADFGVSRIIDGNKRLCTLTQAPGTQIYMSPESLVPSPKYDQQLDIFSFGVLIIHVMLQDFPLPECGPTKLDETDRSKLIAISEVARRAKLLKRMGKEPVLRILAEKCLSNDPKQRPHITNIISDLDILVSQSASELPFSNVIEASQLLTESQSKNDTLLSRAQNIQAQLHAIVDRVKSTSQWSDEVVSDLKTQLHAVSNLATLMVDSRPPHSDKDENRFVVSYTQPSLSAHACDLKITTVQNPEFQGIDVIVRPPINISFSGTYVKTVASGLKKAWGVSVRKHSGQVFVVDENGYDSVLLFNPDGSKKVLVESSRLLQRSPPELSCWYPSGVAVDRDNALLVADSGSKRILKLRVPEHPIGEVILLAKSGDGIFTGTSTSPVGIGVTKDNLVIVCDRENHQLVVLDSNLTFIRTFGSQGKGPSQFQHPWDVAFDSQWNIYVSDCSNQCLKVFSPDFKPLRTVGCPGPTVSNLRAPAGICIDSSDYIYVADKGVMRVFVFDPAGNFRMRFGEYGFQNGQFCKPLGITVDGEGFVYVTDGKGGRVQVFK